MIPGSGLHCVGGTVLYNCRLAVYKHSGSHLPPDWHRPISFFGRGTHVHLEPSGKRAVLENLDLDLLCLDETIDKGYVIQFSHLPHRDKLFSAFCLSTMNYLPVFLCSIYSAVWKRIQRRWVRESEGQSGYDRDRHQRADDHERILDDGGGAPTDRRWI